jgi:aryl-alcohol dehydrogenase-like predicted oxidoreductase
MKTRTLGRTGLEVSPLCLGTMTFGVANEDSFMHQVGCDEDTSMAIMNKALDAGINFFDTADVYGQDGLSERVIGKWFSRDLRREEVVLATKFRFRMGEGPNSSGAARIRIMRTVEASLRRLQTDRIDLYQIHMQDLDTPEEETLRALDDLVRQGKVLYIGASNYAAHRLSDALWTSDTRGWERFCALQANYSLMVRDLEREHVPLSTRHGLGILAYSPLASGFLSGKYKRNQKAPGGTRLAKWKERYAKFDVERNWRILDALEAVATEEDATCAQVALAWLLRKEAVASVLFGARSLSQLDDNLKAATLELSDGAMERLDEASQPAWGYPYEFLKRVQGRW